MAGSVIIWIAFSAALISSYFYYSLGKKHTALLIARNSFYVSVAGVVAVSALLMIYILQHRFEFNYIASYSSRDLPIELLITTFWAGQEGSFMLWALFAALIGLVLQWFTRKKGIEAEAMTFYTTIVAFLLLLILVKSPFQYVWDVPANNLPKGFIPQDGRGLNPLLQNFWMIIHPPILFVGFAAMAVPFVLAVAALWRRKYTDWITAAITMDSLRSAVAWCRLNTRWLLGIWCVGMGRMVGMGSGGKLIAYSLDCDSDSCSYNIDSKVDRKACTNEFHSRSTGILACYL